MSNRKIGVDEIVSVHLMIETGIRRMASGFSFPQLLIGEHPPVQMRLSEMSGCHPGKFFKRSIERRF